MSRIFFHIGLYKTATSWFQRQLFPSLDGVEVIHAKRLDRIAARVAEQQANAKTIIVTHESLSQTISHNRAPGVGLKRLKANLDQVTLITPNRAFIIAFREHASWLRAAYGQRAKKNFGLNPKAYLQAFNEDDLSWSRKLELIKQTGDPVFPFLFEEFILRPEILIDDLCRFLGKSTPANLDQLLSWRENPSPRSWAGQFVSRALVNTIVPDNRKDLKKRVHHFTAKLDRYFPEHAVEIPDDLSQVLKQDWSILLEEISVVRDRDFAEFRRS